MTTCTFGRHFLICGVDPNFGLELDEGPSAAAASSAGQHGSAATAAFNPLERAYKPRLLRKFPVHNKTGSLLSQINDDVLCRLLLPMGLRFCTDRELSSGLSVPRAHPFLLTKEDGERGFGVALTFYEEVHDMNICHAVHTLQKMYSTEAEGGTLKRTDRLRPRSAKVTSERSRSLPRHYQQARLSTSTLDLSSATYDYRKDTLYVVKAIALLCSQPLVTAAVEVLQSMQQYVQRSDYDLHVLEGLLNNVLYDIPVPSPGRSVRFWCLGDAMTLSMPKVPSELPVYDYNLLDFFDILGLENAVKLFVCVLLEHQVLVYSSEVDKLMLVCEAVSTLLYPFRWPHVYVPILPPNLENFLDAPVPYIMGLLRRTHDIELSKKGSVCIVDIDNGELDLPEELPTFPYEKELIEEVRNNILKFGGKDGADVLKEHALETRDILENAQIMNHSVGPGMTKRPMTGQSPNLNSSCSDLLDTMEELNKMISHFETLSASSRPVMNRHTDRLRLNNALREVFVHRFVHMFVSYEHFVIITDELEGKVDHISLTPQQQETQQNFDKTSFLSDQKQSHLAFLSSFLETQMFSTFIDECIVKLTSDSIEESPFDARLRTLKERFGDSLVRTPTYENCDRIDTTDAVLTKRLKKVELTVKPEKVTTSSSRHSPRKQMTAGVFPLLDPSHFEPRSRTDNACIFVPGDRKSKALDPAALATPVVANKISMLSASPAAIAETNWKFVAQLLKECRDKTKRILLEKLGQEAIEWGHGEVGFSGSEENMLVASVCDLIERIWSHGLQNRHGKSSLWHFLSKFGRANEKLLRFKGTLGTQAFCVSLARNSKPYVLPDHARDVQILVNPQRKTATFDSTVMAVMHNVSTIREIKTEIGYARAWIRLALERKSLSGFLHVLVSDAVLLKNLYKRYAFLRCEDEREQSLYYLQTLNTVEFTCFTNAYTKSSILYQVLIFPSNSPKTGLQMTTANLWLHVVGSHGETDILHLPRAKLHFAFWAKNLGIITSLRLAHDNAGSSPNYSVDYILLRNEFTGQMFKFTCGRGIGSSCDDGSTERYMVGYPMPQEANISALVQGCLKPPEVTCPALRVKPSPNFEADGGIVELQTKLGDAINRIIKFYHKSLNERLISYAHLMCGRDGLVHALLDIFSFGFKSSRIFGRNLFVWDFFLKVTMDFNTAMAHHLGPGSATNSPMHSPKRNANTLDSPAAPRRNSSLSNLLDSPKRSIPSTTPQGTLSRSNQFRRMYTKLITRIETTCVRLGKDDKFQLFVCLAAHDRLLGRIVTDLTKAVAAQQLYDDTSFFRNANLASFLSHILEALEDISVPVDPAMKMTLEQHFNL